MTKFEMIGANKQYAAKTAEEAEAQFNASCTMCCTSIRCWRKCERCAIETAHRIVMNGFDLDELNRAMERRLIQTNMRMGLA